MKILFMLLFLLSQSVIAQFSDVDSIIYSTTIYDEVEEWVYENKGTVITRELQIIRYALFEIDATVYFIKYFEPLNIKFDARLGEGVKNALTIYFNKGYGIGHRDGLIEGHEKGWKEAKDDSGAKIFYTTIIAIVITSSVMYGIQY